jgi:hypothetical protein
MAGRTTRLRHPPVLETPAPENVAMPVWQESAARSHAMVAGKSGDRGCETFRWYCQCLLADSCSVDRAHVASRQSATGCTDIV